MTERQFELTHKLANIGLLPEEQAELDFIEAQGEQLEPETCQQLRVWYQSQVSMPDDFQKTLIERLMELI